MYPVHRLDKGTSGVLLFALDPEAVRELGRRFMAGAVDKRYLAVVRGHPSAAGVEEHALAPMADTGAGVTCGGAPRPAVTHFRLLARAELPYRVDRYPSSRYALVELRPLTGRRRQLRRHMKYIAHPIIGDATHGKGRHNRLFAELFGSRRLLLAAVRLRHPVSGADLDARAPPAADFTRVLVGLGWTDPAAGGFVTDLLA